MVNLHMGYEIGTVVMMDMKTPTTLAGAFIVMQNGNFCAQAQMAHDDQTGGHDGSQRID